MKLISNTVLLCALSVGSLASPLATADSALNADFKTDYKYEITPFGGFRTGGAFEDATDDSRRELDNGSSYGVLLHLIQVPGAYYEFSYSKQTTELQGASPFDLTVEYFHVGGTLEFAQPEDRVRPYLALAVGATRFAPKDTTLDEKTAASMSLGFGAKIPVASHVAVRLEARAYASFLNSDSDVFCAGTGEAAVCSVQVQSDYLIQLQGMLGVTFGF
jgi:opacity protein-like surface antigen